MRKWALLVSVLIGLVAAAYMAWGRAPAGIQPDAPPEVNTEADVVPVPDSVILLSARLGLAELQGLANAQVPVSQSGEEADPVPDPLKNDVARWRIDRGEIAAVARDGALILSAPLSGTVAISGTVKFLVKVKLKAAGVIAGLVSATARPVLSKDWRVRPGLTLAADITQADIPLEGFGTISVKGLIRRDAERLIADIGDRLDGRLAADDFLESAARKLWMDVCAVHHLTLADESAALVVEPSAFMASQPIIGAEGVSIALGLRARARITRADGPEIACGPLAALELVPAPPEGSFALAVPIEMDWETASRLASEAIAKKPVFGSADGLVRAVATRITFRPHGRRILARLDFTATASTWLGEASFDAFVFATAMPVFEPEDATLRFDAVKLTTESGIALGTRSALSNWLVGLVGAPEVSFAKLVVKAKRVAVKALEKLKSKLPGIDAGATEVEDFAIREVLVRDSGIVVMAMARGRAEAAILNIEFAQ